jgi:hypothetical protein
VSTKSQEGHNHLGDAKRLHRLRRSFCKSWRNDKWRELALPPRKRPAQGLFLTTRAICCACANWNASTARAAMWSGAFWLARFPQTKSFDTFEFAAHVAEQGAGSGTDTLRVDREAEQIIGRGLDVLI